MTAKHLAKYFGIGTAKVNRIIEQLGIQQRRINHRIAQPLSPDSVYRIVAELRKEQGAKILKQLERSI